jgi:type I restriction enzyme R subunit
MESVNFEFLRKKAGWQPLADLGGFGERYARPDPVAALVKLRAFGEVLVGWIYDLLKLPRPIRATLNDLLVNRAFQDVTPRVVLAKLHAIRKEGNRAAHGEAVDQPTSLWILKEAFDLGCWLHLTYGGGAKADLPAYAEPTADGGNGATRAVNRAILEKLAAQEALMQRLLEDLEAARTQARAAELSVAELQAAQAGVLPAANEAADALQFDEAATRRVLIDRFLAEAGWKVGKDGTDTDEVRQGVEVGDEPTPSGKGEADYVLFGGDGKPLAVIEAKKTATDHEAGRTQAKLYADGLEKQYGVRPFVYYTNGYDISFWNDAAGEPPRRVYGFHAKDSLQYRRFQLAEREPRGKVAPSGEIITRLYQFEAVKKIVERFAEKKRKALLVQATGTGKTRVTVALCDALIRAKWARRILFLCDRRPLRKQADNAFKEFLAAEPRTTVTADTAKDRDKRVYVATYPAMMKCFQTFDVGFFDLIIADESHRSIYNRYRDLFEYFDSYQVGLTATPVKFVLRDTYKIFECEVEDPTFNYDYREAIEQGYLVHFEVETHTTPFLREGIKYSQMSAAQREQLEAEGGDPNLVEHDPEEVDRVAYNKDTNRLILRNLMEHGIRDGSGSHVGKTIVFARNHNHAVLLENLFEEMYPQYGGDFCRVIDSHDERAEELIEEFKDPKSDLTVAISVDMLDTGIDVPEVVNLVFAKPVYSYAKFWQMIGRGTRLCPNLFGPGKDKTQFLIFDHWGNFERFDEDYEEATPAAARSLMQQVFEGRIRLAETALAVQDQDAFNLAIDLLGKDLAALPERSIAVREKWKEVQTVSRPEVLRQFDEVTKVVLKNVVAPLMQWVPIGGHEDAYRLDKLICQLQAEKLRGSGAFDDRKADLLNDVGQLQINLTQVAVKVPVIEKLKTSEFWANADVAALEEVRQELRGVMQYRLKPVGPTQLPRVYDIKEDPALVERKRHVPRLEGLELAAYRNRVVKVLTDLFEQNATLQKIKAGEPVSEADLRALVSLVLTQDGSLDLTDLLEYYPETAGQLDRAIRAVIGMDAGAVRARFTAFVTAHPELNSHQVKFLDLLQNHLARYGSIEVGDLYEPPFTLLHSDGLDGVFEEPLAEELLGVLRSFSPTATTSEPEA